MNDPLQKIFSKGYCRGADAHHLACALYLDPEKSHLHFLTTVETQAKLAQKVGFALALGAQL